MPPGPTRHSRHYPLDSGDFQDAKKYENGKRNAWCVADGNRSLSRK